MPHRVYVEAEVADGSDVDILLRDIGSEHTVRKVVVLVWFDAEDRPTPSELAHYDHWDVS